MRNKRSTLFIVAVFLLAGPLAGSALTFEQAGVPFLTPEIIFHDGSDPTGPQTLFGDDVLLADLNPDIEGNPDMVSSDSWGMFLIWESMDPNNTHIYIYRSTDGGGHWSQFGEVVGGAPYEIRDPALALPENTQDYLYMVYEYADQIQVLKLDLATMIETYSNVDVSALGVHHPRIITDDWDYPGNYWVYVTYIAGTDLGGQLGYNVKAARSSDYAATWEYHTTLHTTDPGGSPPTPDIGYGESTLYATWDGNEPAPGIVDDIYASRSTNLALSWDAAVNLTSAVSVNCFGPRVAAIRGDEISGGEVVVAYSLEYTADDLDVWYNFSLDKGLSWSAANCLACASNWDEAAPDVGADPSYGYFHVAYWQDYSIRYVNAHRSAPTVWSTPEMISDTGEASWGYSPPTSAYDWATGERGIAWSDFRTPTYAVYFDRQGWIPRTVACSYTCDPMSGVVPFSTLMSVSLDNLYAGQIRRIAGHIDVYLAGGQSYSNWRAGWTNIAASDSYSNSWIQNIPGLSPLIGTNIFHVIAEDVTPAPYNQPPYPMGGGTATAYCTLLGSAP